MAVHNVSKNGLLKQCCLRIDRNAIDVRQVRLCDALLTRAAKTPHLFHIVLRSRPHHAPPQDAAMQIDVWGQLHSVLLHKQRSPVPLLTTAISDR